MWCFCFVMTMCMELWPCVCVELNQHQFHFQTIWCGPIIILVINKYNVIMTKIIWWCKCMLDLPNVVVDNFLLCTSIKSIFPSLSLGFSDLCSLIFNNLKSWNDYLQYYSLFSSRICGTFMIVLDAVLDQLPTSWIVTSWCINNLYLPNTALALGYKIYLLLLSLDGMPTHHKLSCTRLFLLRTPHPPPPVWLQFVVFLAIPIGFQVCEFEGSFLFISLLACLWTCYSLECHNCTHPRRPRGC